MHDNDIRLRHGQFLVIQAVALMIILQRDGEFARRHAFMLDAQHHHHIGALNAFFHIVEGFDSQLVGIMAA